MGTRRTATVLFTDLVGSTEQRGRLGDDVGDEFRREHDRLVGNDVVRCAGQVVKSTGDGLLAVFDSAADALDAAVSAQQSITDRNRSATEPMTVRVGMSIGDVVVEDDGDVFGTPVVEAGRLCDRAAGGQILCTDFVRGMAGTRGGHQFDSLGAFDLQGLADPVSAHVVRWSPRASSSPLPRLLVRAHTFAHVYIRWGDTGLEDICCQYSDIFVYQPSFDTFEALNKEPEFSLKNVVPGLLWHLE